MKTLLVVMILVVIFALALFSSSSDNSSSCGDMTIAADGESVADVASRCNVSPDAILALNPGITDSNHLPGGMVLHLPLFNNQASTNRTSSADVNPTPVIPVTGNQVQTFPTPASQLPATLATEAPLRASVQSSSSAPSGNIISYTVQPGDTLASIASRNGTTVAAIMALNPTIEDPNLIYPGEVIQVDP